MKVSHAAFKRVVRDLEFDVAELAIVTFLMAKAGGVTPRGLDGRRTGMRSYTVTTAAWIRGRPRQ